MPSAHRAERKSHLHAVPEVRRRPRRKSSTTTSRSTVPGLWRHLARRGRDRDARARGPEQRPRVLRSTCSAWRKVSALPRPGDPVITPALVAEHGLTADEYERLVDMLGRDADVHRARDRQRALERALLLQAFAAAAPHAADQGAVRAAGPRRERRRHLDRRRAGGRVQDRVAQPSVRRRAVSGRGDRRRRHSARRVHDGRAADRDAQLAALRLARLARAFATCSPASSRASATTATASASRRSPARSSSIRRTRAIRSSTRCASAHARGGADSRRGAGRRQPDHRRRRAHGPRRHSRRVVRVGGSLGRRATPSARACRSAIRSPRSCCSRRRSS